jgi:chorismate-pyruvate lyase
MEHGLPVGNPNPWAASTSSPLRPITQPLSDFYAAAGVELPPIERVSPDAVPEPFKSLLVHADDMTPTLERFHQHVLRIRVLGKRQLGETYLREVVLITEGDEIPVEFGAIRINLALFPAAARDLILAETLPLGRILADCRVPHSSHPSAFLRVQSDALIGSALGLLDPQVLYGRRNTLVDASNRPLAEIVEILPPDRCTRA